MTPPVAIVGAGITGLTAAFRLRQRGVPFVLYEAGPCAGGVVQTVEKDGYLAEAGPNTLLETSSIIKGLLAELNLGAGQIYSNPSAEKRFLVRGGQIHALPGSLLGWLTTTLFSFPAKLRALGDFFQPRGREDQEETVADFVRRRLGQEFLDYAINPFVAGIYAGDPERLSLREAFPKLHAVEQKYRSLFLGQFFGALERRRTGEISKAKAPKLSFLHGLGTLPAAIFEEVKESVRLKTSVTAIRRTGDLWTITSQLANLVEEQAHSAVVLAAPSHKLAQIAWDTRDGESLGWLAEIPYAPVTSLVLGFKRSEVRHPLDGFGVLVPAVEKIPILGVIFNSSLFPNRAPDGHVTLTCYLGGRRDPALAIAAEEVQISTALPALHALLGVTGRPTFIHRTCYHRAIPQYEIGFGKFRERMSALEQRNPGLILAGHFRDGISLNDSILAGHHAGLKLADEFKNQTFNDSHSPVAAVHP